MNEGAMETYNLESSSDSRDSNFNLRTFLRNFRRKTRIVMIAGLRRSPLGHRVVRIYRSELCICVSDTQIRGR